MASGAPSAGFTTFLDTGFFLVALDSLAERLAEHTTRGFAAKSPLNP